jgi:hypothetical protein
MKPDKAQMVDEVCVTAVVHTVTSVEECDVYTRIIIKRISFFTREIPGKTSH